MAPSSAHAKVDDIERVESKISKIVVHRIDKLLARKRMNPGFVRWPPSPELGDYHQSIRIRMKRLLMIWLVTCGP